MPDISITGVFGDEARRARSILDCIGHRGRGRLADRATFLADQKHHRIVALVIVHAGDERVAALDTVHECLARVENRARDKR